MSTKNKWTLKTHYPYLLKWGISYAYPEGPLDGLEVFGDGEGELLFEPRLGFLTSNSFTLSRLFSVLSRTAAFVP